MSTKILDLQKVPPDFYTYGDVMPMFHLKNGWVKESTFPALASSVAASVSSVQNEATIEVTDPSPLFNGQITDILYEMQITSATADGTVTFYNPWLHLWQIAVYLDGVLIDELANQDQIRFRWSDYIRGIQGQTMNYADYQRTVETTGTTLNGLVFTNGATKYVSMSLLTLFPYLKWFPTYAFRKLRFVWRYATDGASVTTTPQFCVSSTATNNYATLAYGSIQLRIQVATQADPRLNVLDRKKQRFYIRKYKDIRKTGSFNTSGTDYYRINLKNEFSNTKNCIGCYYYIFSTANLTAYSDSDSQVMTSLPESCCPILRLNTNVLFDHSSATADLLKRRRYCHDVQLNNFSVPFDSSALTPTNNLNKYNLILGLIDFQNIAIDQGHEWNLGTGIDSNTNVEFDIYCGSTGVSSNAATAGVFGLIYYDLVDLSGGVPRLLSQF